ncbi:MAG: hypothetical protein IKA93_02235 [Elusimicrobiaceae bacterium]|nr:hypothetical protein [Elusimicrobiaceae bacterium]
MIKTNKCLNYLVVFLFCFSLVSGNFVFAASPAKQLAKGISLYEKNKTEEAMSYFIEVMVNGNKEQVAEANKYVELIHNRVGGIQTPVEVDINFKEGEVKSLDEVTDAAIVEAQKQAEAAAAEATAKAKAAKEEAEAAALAKQQEALEAVDAQQQALTEQIEAQRQAAMERAEASRQEALQKAADVNEALLEATTVKATAGEANLPQTTQEDLKAIEKQTTSVLDAAQSSAANAPRQETVMTTVAAAEPVSSTEATPATEAAGSTFVDLTTPEALNAREIYTNQKIDSMTNSAIEKITAAKGVHLYFRDNKPDALDIDPEVIFDGSKFRTESLPLLNNIYELLALTQGASYTILPPGSYTDDVTLPGIRQAMALNSYLTNRGISEGKLHYNMGLVDAEPPAQFANLNGLSIVFDYTAQLPANLEKNEKNEKAPLLSMAVVPLCHAIDRSLGEAFVIDFSVLETVNPIDNWVLQVVQHGRDGKFYVVRQLEGFSPVYHQILWNGRKGIIGPELPCGKYTLVLTATDLKGEKKTLRRRIVVKCSEQKTSTCSTGSCSTKKDSSEELCPKCNYKTARLWVKPGRTMKAVVAEEPAVEAMPAAPAQAAANPLANPAPVADAMPQDLTDPLGADPYATGDMFAPVASQPADATIPVNNPYDMPYEEYNAN